MDYLKQTNEKAHVKPLDRPLSVEEITDVEQLKKINRALMKRVESSMDQHGNAFSLFQTAIGLEGQVRRRTDELTEALNGMKKINAELEQAKEASENANLSKTRFLAAASHDVLQPLNAAMLSLSVLADMQESDVGKQIAEQIERSLDTMNELLKTLLDISKLDAGTIQPRIETIYLPDFIDHIMADFKHIAKEKNLVFEAEVLPLSVRSDRTMLRRIIQNLVSNGLRYTQCGSVTIKVEAQDEMATFSVTDTGLGIAPEHHDQVFEEFHRGALPAGHDREANSGLGLGLSIVKRMVDALGHRLDLTSQIGKGTCFSIHLPVSRQTAGLTPALKQETPIGSSSLEGVRILLVENDPAGVEAGVTLFCNWGCDIRVAANIAETLETLNDTAWIPQIIVADLHLDHGDLGTIAINEARAFLGVHVPAVIITADPTKAAERDIRDNGMELLLKPIKPAQLRALMAHMLASVKKT